MKINFEYSLVYDMMLGEMMGSFDVKPEKDSRIYINSVRKFWDKKGARIIKEIENVSKLKFKRDVECFVVNSMFYESLSHPFTIKIEKDFDRLFAIFVHELVHILLVQNFKKVAPLVNLIGRDSNYRVHFPALLIERKVLEKLNKSYKKQKRIEDLDYVWKDVNKVYNEFKSSNKGIADFLRNYVTSRQA